MSDDQTRIGSIARLFQKHFGSAPQVIARAPGRVEVIGGHTDYNDGYVMPVAINLDVLMAASAAPGDTVTVYSCNFDETSSFSVTDIQHSSTETWSNYIRGVIDQIRKAGLTVPGLNLVVEGTVPLGSGLSSSAALEVATATAVLAVTGATMDGPDVALLCQRAENQFVGVNSGIMDQFISVLGQEGKAMFLDCRSLDHQFVKLPNDTNIVVADSKKPRTLAGSEYNIRRAQCEEAVKILKEWLPNVKALRDVSVEDLETYGDRLPDIVRKRARHVVHENDRVLKCVHALNRGNAAEFGEMLSQSHASARDLYEISCPELNWLQEAAVSVEGCLGSRLTGAGFGGCTVSIVRSNSVEEFSQVVIHDYVEKAGFEPEITVLEAAGGAGLAG